MQFNPESRENLNLFTVKMKHPFRKELLQILVGDTSVSSSGFPFISQESFEDFKKIPHLFTNGENLLVWLEKLENKLGDSTSFTEEELGQLQRTIKVLRTITYTASITAPPDLWVLRYILSVHQQAGTLEFLFQGNVLAIEKYSSKYHLDSKQLALDMSFLFSRGYLSSSENGYTMADVPQSREVFQNIASLKPKLIGNWVNSFIALFQDPNNRELKKQIEEFLDFPVGAPAKAGWQAGTYEIEIAFRLLPLVLALRALEWTSKLKKGIVCTNVIPSIAKIEGFLQRAGLIDVKNCVTLLGQRVFARGAGPFGIIHTYYPYMEKLSELVHGKTISTWVNRGENVAASQDANRKTFSMGNRSLDQFCQKYGYSFDVFIEHAVGQGEATRQRFEINGEKNIQYFGADLEQEAIKKAVANQEKGELPQNMIFIQADIGAPETLIKEIHKAGFSTFSAVMLVGNGFHEIRRQTNEKMIQVFYKYQEAGILLIFTEESALRDQDLINTAWNTYHTGFRYVHKLSGQGLRPAYDRENQERYSWKKCATLADYHVLARYTTKTRTIYPHPSKDGYNPSISVNYFCIPKKLAQKLKIAL